MRLDRDESRGEMEARLGGVEGSGAGGERVAGWGWGGWRKGG